MGQVDPISDELFREAQVAADMAERSIDEQIEYWAYLGRAIERILGHAESMALIDRFKKKSREAAK